MLLDLLRQDEEKIAQAGPKAIKKALEAGVPVYYMDETLGRGIVREMPDGSRHLIEMDDGKRDCRADPCAPVDECSVRCSHEEFHQRPQA